ncbi:MAG TPA: outer membrane beta-barrel protein [Pseudolabrys sp.]|nr:outer membrane beta-barrel protein [Pseudolabrys sp.]
MSWFKRLALAGIIFADASHAFAADMPGAYPMPVFKAPPLVELSYAWYMRGDLGYGWGTLGDAQRAPGRADPNGNKLGGGFVGGVGAGFKSRWLRTDATLDYTGPLKYSGNVGVPGGIGANVTAVTALFNGYLDLGTWYHATPYVGAGLGATQLRIDDYVNAAAPLTTSGLSNTQYNFAWAVMAGVGFAVAPNIMIDAGYRYVNFGDVTIAGDTASALTLKNLAAHEVRVGFRWSFDDLYPVH